MLQFGKIQYSTFNIADKNLIGLCGRIFANQPIRSQLDKLFFLRLLITNLRSYLSKTRRQLITDRCWICKSLSQTKLFTKLVYLNTLILKKVVKINREHLKHSILYSYESSFPNHLINVDAINEYFTKSFLNDSPTSWTEICLQLTDTTTILRSESRKMLLTTSKEKVLSVSEYSNSKDKAELLGKQFNANSTLLLPINLLVSSPKRFLQR